MRPIAHLTSSQVATFRKTVYRHYAKHGRHLPWRKTANPYRILVSEIMLQQTQVDRVVSKYLEFVKRFPTVAALARASVRDALDAWQGLGYNRRGLMLRRCAQEIVSVYKGHVPRTPRELDSLPGIGAATAASIAAYAFGQPTVFIETNVRTVFIHHFFAKRKAVSDAEIYPLADRTLDRSNPSRWYNALMDYGVFLKKQYGNPARASSHHTRQSRFEGSNRQIRGAILRLLLKKRQVAQGELEKHFGAIEPRRLDDIVIRLVQEGFVEKKGKAYKFVGN